MLLFALPCSQQMLWLLAELFTLSTVALAAVRSIMPASRVEQKTIRTQPDALSDVALECFSTEAEMARRLEVAEAALAVRDVELATERAVAREAVAQAVAAREAAVRAQAARASMEQAAAEVVAAAELVQAQAAEAWRGLEEAGAAHVAELKAKEDFLDAAREAVAATSAGAETAVDNAQVRAVPPSPSTRLATPPGACGVSPLISLRPSPAVHTPSPSRATLALGAGDKA